jgi:tetratricopeptide (TPR) repeat protein
MTPTRSVVLSLLVLAGLPDAGQAAAQRMDSQGRSSVARRQFVVLKIRTSAGYAVPGAVAMVGELAAVSADPQGDVRIELKPPMRLPLLVDIQARGYRSRQIMIEGFERSAIDVYLEAEAAGPRPGDQTVSAAELSPEKRQEVQKLENAGVRALAANDNPTAESLFRSAFELNPNSSLLATNLGIAVLRQGRPDEALVFLEKAYQLGPYQAFTVGNLALVRWMQGRYDDCYPLADRAIALGFKSELVRYSLGVLALGRGYHKQSALELGHVDPERFPYRDLFLSIALRGLGQSKAAARAFDTFLQHQSVALFVADTHGAPATVDPGVDVARDASRLNAAVPRP